MQLRYKVVYEMAVNAHDNKSGKPIVNLFYLRSAAQSPEVLLYGDLIPNTDTDILMPQFEDKFAVNILPLLSENYVIDDFVLREIRGWSTVGPWSPIVDASNSSPITITTTHKHGLVSGDLVTIQNCQGNTAANGASQPVTVTGPKVFNIAGVGNGVYVPMSGEWRSEQAAKRWIYRDTATHLPVLPNQGTVMGEAIPLHATMSVRRTTALAGKKWRGGIRLSPIAESDNVNGTCTDARQAIRVANWATLKAASYRGAPSPAAPEAYLLNWFPSKKASFATISPFAESATWSTAITGFLPRQNEGVLRSRKPKLTAPIIH